MKGFSLFSNLYKLLILLVAFYGASSASAEMAVSMGVGYGVNDSIGGRVGVIKKWDRLWRAEDCWHFTGYYEGSYYYLKGKRRYTFESENNIQIGALAAVFRYFRGQPWHGLWPFFDIGVGASYVSRLEFTSRKLGIHYQFEDRFGTGVRFGDRQQYEFGYRFIHFSNARLHEINHGINTQFLIFSYWI